MYTPPSLRFANAYRTVAAASSVDGASAHRLIELLFDGLLQSLAATRGAMERNEVATKGLQIQRSIRFLEEGLKAGLDDARGGELAAKLRSLYDYCVERLTVANLTNDATAVAEVASLISPVAEGWKEMGRGVSGQAT
ncbi:MAG: flagellar export chaperone FliS [Burkholderiaceae bacterium]